MTKVRELYPKSKKPLFREHLVTTGDLEEFKTDLLLAIRSLLAEHMNQTPKQWMKSYEVRNLLGISNGTLQTLRNNGTIPYTKLGGIFYYDRAAIEKIFTERQRQLLPGLMPDRRIYKNVRK